MANARLKIGLLTDNYPFSGDAPPSTPGGIGTYTQLVAEELARLGHEAHVFAFASVPRHRCIEHNGVRLWQLPAWSRRRQMTVAQAAEFTLRHRNDALMLSRYSALSGLRLAVSANGAFDLIESPDAGAMGELVRGKRFTARYAVRLHCVPPADWPKDGTPLERDTGADVKAADVVTAPTEFARRSAIGFWGCDPARIVVVHNPLRPVAVATGSWPEGPSAVLFGRLGWQKGVDFFAGAIGRVAARIPDFRATFIGPDMTWIQGEPRWATGQMATAVIRQAAERSGGTGRYRVRAPMGHDALIEAVRAHSLCVFPSRTETFGMALTEAMAWGVPCVASDIPPFRELADGNCVFAPVGSEAALADAVTAMLSNPEEARRMAARAIERARAYSVERVVPQLLKAWFA